MIGDTVVPLAQNWLLPYFQETSKGTPLCLHVHLVVLTSAALPSLTSADQMMLHDNIETVNANYVKNRQFAKQRKKS